MSGDRNPGDRTPDNRIENNRTGNNRISDDRITGDLSANDLLSDNEMSSESIGGNVNPPVFTPYDTTPRGGGCGGGVEDFPFSNTDPDAGGAPAVPVRGRGRPRKDKRSAEGNNNEVYKSDTALNTPAVIRTRESDTIANYANKGDKSAATESDLNGPVIGPDNQVHTSESDSRVSIDTGAKPLNADRLTVPPTTYGTGNRRSERTGSDTNTNAKMVIPETRSNKRKCKREQIVQKAMEAWDDEYLAKEQEKCPDVWPIRQWVLDNYKPSWNEMRAENPSNKAYWQQWDSLYVRNGVLYRRLEPARHTDEPVSQLILPRALRDTFLKTVHEGVAGHLGSLKTRSHVGRRAYWFKWRRDVDMYCLKCVACCEYKKGRRPPRQGYLMPMVLGSPFERWGVDLAGPFPHSTKGHEYILTAIDVFTKYMILVAIKDKTAVTVAKAIYDNVFLMFGAGEILTGNGTEFKNQLLNEICRILGIQRSYTTSYEARANAVC